MNAKTKFRSANIIYIVSMLLLIPLLAWNIANDGAVLPIVFLVISGTWGWIKLRNRYKRQEIH